MLPSTERRGKPIARLERKFMSQRRGGPIPQQLPDPRRECGCNSSDGLQSGVGSVSDAQSLPPRFLFADMLLPLPLLHCSRAFSVATQFTVSTGKRVKLPRGMPMVTRMFASSEHAWDPMASSSVDFCRKTRTVHYNLCCFRSRSFAFW
jgi:hypothetical protein